jgi:MFS transporter, DHA1 family, inner membrane transport protein
MANSRTRETRDMTDQATSLRSSDRSTGTLVEPISALLIGVCGPTLFVIVPFFLTFVKVGRGFDESQISLISSADMLGMFVANGLAALWIRAANWRLVSLGALVLLIISTLGSMYTESFAAFGLTRIAAGFGAGCLMGIGLTAMGEQRRSDAWFGWFVAVQALLGTITSWAIPRFIEPHGLDGLLIALIVIYILLFPCALRVPRYAKALPSMATTAGSGPSVELAVLSLVAAFAFYMGIFAVWSHIDLIGRAAGINPTRIGDAVSMGYLLGIPASIAAVVLAGRVRRMWFFIIIGAIQIVALAILRSGPALFGFSAATLMLGWLWYFSAPPQMGITVTVDPTGRFIVLFVAAMKSSYVAAGAILAILLARGGSLNRITLFSGICALVSLAIYVTLSVKIASSAATAEPNVATESSPTMPSAST